MFIFNFSINSITIFLGKSFIVSSFISLYKLFDKSFIFCIQIIKSFISSSFNIVFSISILPSLNIFFISSYFLVFIKYNVSGFSFNFIKNSSNNISLLFSWFSDIFKFIPKLYLSISNIILFISFNNIFLFSKFSIDLFKNFINSELFNKLFILLLIISLIFLFELLIDSFLFWFS